MLIFKKSLNRGLDVQLGKSQEFCSLCGKFSEFILFFHFRIRKLEKEITLVLQCKRNGWTDLSAELGQYEKLLQNEKDAESKGL